MIIPKPSRVNASLSRQRCIEPGCRASYGINERLYVCSRCGGLLDLELGEEQISDAKSLPSLWRERLRSFDMADRSGVWRFRELLPFDDSPPIVSLGEGNTPLYDAPRSASYCGVDALQVKHQGCNPTGSFKDTGMTTAVTQARLLGVRLLVCASTGNTSASLAAYAARAGLLCAIMVPEGQVSHAKLAQSLDYGAKVLEIEGNFDACMRLMRELARDESIYLVNSINPFRIEGQKTVAAELAEQLDWHVPDHLVVPGGNLGNSSAFGKGFHELFKLGLIDRMPRITIVQAAGAAPFARLFSQHERELTMEDPSFDIVNLDHPHTLASAIKIGAPVSWKKAWRALRWTGGQVVTVSEQQIADAKAMIGRDGIGCEPASATTVAGIKKLVAEGTINGDEHVVAVLTGHLLKDTDYVINYHSQGLRVSWEGVPESEQRIVSHFSNRPVRVEALESVIKKVLDRLQNEHEPSERTA
jgi:threonine synthase